MQYIHTFQNIYLIAGKKRIFKQKTRQVRVEKISSSPIKKNVLFIIKTFVAQCARFLKHNRNKIVNSRIVL